MPLRRSSPHSSATDREDMISAWESNDYIDFMAAVALGVMLTALAFTVM
jgi:hypothetical protein